MKKLLTIRNFILMILLMIMISPSLPAQVENRVVNFDVRMLKDNIELYWDANMSDPQPNGFYLLYRNLRDSSGNQEYMKINMFDLQNVQDSNYIIAGNQYLSSDYGNTWNNTGYFFYGGTNNPSDTFRADIMNKIFRPGNAYEFVMVTYYNQGQESAITNYSRTLYIPIDTVNQETITFTTQPIGKAYVGETYTYDANAVASDSGTVKYNLRQAPDGMTIDEHTGIVSWTPTRKGEFPVLIDAYLESDPSVISTQVYYVWSYKCHQLATVTGHIKDEFAIPVDYGMVFAYEKDVNSRDSLTLIGSGRIAFGDYYLILDEGTYSLYFEGFGNFESFWYDNTQDMKQATPIDVACGDTVIMKNLVVKNINQPVQHRITGTVIRSDDMSPKGQPVPYAVVEFWAKSDNPQQSMVFRTYTNSEGKYELLLSDQYQYIALVDASQPIQGRTETFIVRYYNETNDPTQAELISLNRIDSAKTFDFTLDPRTSNNNNISGTVADENGNLIDRAYVIGYMVERDSSVKINTYYFESVVADSGQFTLRNLIPGKYVLLAIPPVKDFVAGYYKENDFAVIDWQDATILTVESNSSIGPINIKLEKTTKFLGSAKVSGDIGEKNLVLKSKDMPQGSNVIDGAIVYLVNSDGKIIDYTMSDNKGHYEIDNLEAGDYQLYGNRIYYEQYKQNVKAETDKTVNADFSLTKLEVFTDVTDNGNVQLEVRVYPNPALDVANILSLNNSIINKIEVVNYLGVTVLTRENVNSDKMSINLKDLPSGVYYIKVSGSNFVNVLPLSLSK